MLVLPIFILLSIGMLAQGIPISFAKKGIQKSEFSCYASGRGFVIWNGYIGSPSQPTSYSENTLESFVFYSGSALVEEYPDLKKWYVSSEIQGSGFLVAEWTHNGNVFSIVIGFQSTEETSGFFNPKIDCFAVPAFFAPDPIPEEQFMYYEGIFTEKIDGVYTSRLISGWASLTVYLHLNVYRLVVVFGLELEDGTTIPVNIAWLNKEFLGFYGASVFYHNVNLVKE